MVSVLQQGISKMARQPNSGPINSWPADAVSRRAVADLVPYARNARTHSDAQVAQIAASIRQWGWTTPVLIDTDGLIIAGHGRVLAARQLGITDVPAMVATGWSEAQKRAYTLADNQLAANAGWDLDMLGVEMKDLQLEGFDLDLIGFDDKTMAGLLADLNDGLTDPDDAPEPPVNPVSRLGDVWLLGKHRIVCGDCTDPLVVDAALAGVKPHLMVTDPPYGVEYDAGWRNTAMPQKNDPTRWKDGAGSPTGAVLNDNKSDWREAWALFPGDVAYVWHAGLRARSVAESLEAAGFIMRAQIIWNKSRFVISRGDYHYQHEPCWYAVRKGKPGRWAGDRKQTTVWDIAHTKSETGHSTQKPIECMKRPIENNSSPGQAIYEPFSGSGTTIIAAEMTGRVCYAIELSPAYVDVAVLRWQAFTGQAATLDDGRAFGDIGGDRNGGEG